MDAQEPNPGRLAKRDDLRRQRRSVFMTALIGATLTAVLAGAAAFRIKDTRGGTVKIVTTTTTTLPDTTTDTSADDSDTTLYVPPDSTGTDASPTTVPATTTSAATTTTSTSTTTTTPGGPPPPPPAPHMTWSVSPNSATLQSGAQASVTITVVNTGNAAGNVNVPGCPSAPVKFARPVTLSNSCHPGAAVVTVGPGGVAQWTDTVAATSDATRYGTPLATGNYEVVVASSPVLLFTLHVTP